MEPSEPGLERRCRHGCCAADGGHARRKGCTMTHDLDESGPIDYLVVEFPGNKMNGEAFPLLVDLVDRGVIRILDLAFITREADGSVAGLSISDIDGDGELDLTVFEGASSGLLDAS